MRITLVLVAFGFLVSGCAVGVKHDYSLGDLDIEVDKNAHVAVAVHDRRSYVRLGDKAPDFVGLSRGGFGNPFDVTTVSGAALADDIASAIATSIRAKGATVAIVSTNPTLKESAVLALLRAKNFSRSVLVTLTEWKADTYLNTSVIYDLSILILGADARSD